MLKPAGDAVPSTSQQTIGMVCADTATFGGQARLSEIAEDVARIHERVQITKKGREHVVLVAAEDLGAIEATLELLSGSETQKRLQVAEAEVSAGDVLTSRRSVSSLPLGL
jgi:antitoxin YefM